MRWCRSMWRGGAGCARRCGCGASRAGCVCGAGVRTGPMWAGRRVRCVATGSTRSTSGIRGWVAFRGGPAAPRFGGPSVPVGGRTPVAAYRKAAQWGGGQLEGEAAGRTILDPAVVTGYAGRPVGPALRLDEVRARAVARQLDELRRLRYAATARGDVAA